MHKKIVKRKNEINPSMKNLVAILTSNAISLVCTVFLTAICSLILMKSQVLSDSLTPYFVGCLAIGSLINGFISAKKCSLKGILSGLISAVPFAFVIVIIMIFFTRGQLAPNTFLVLLTALVCSTLGGIFGANTRRRR